MDNAGKIVLSIYGLSICAAIIIIVFLIIRRGNTKKNEDFENRDN